MEKAWGNMGCMKTLKELGYEVVPIGNLTKADWNYKEDDEEKLKKLVENIRRNKQIENLIVREYKGKLEIVNGNHRYDALETIGMEFAVVNNLGDITDAEAKRIAVETNETRFPTDKVSLGDVIKQISQEFSFEELAETMPYSEDEIEELSKLADFDPDAFEGDAVVEEENSKFLFVIDFQNEDRKQMFLELLNQHGSEDTTPSEVLIVALSKLDS